MTTSTLSNGGVLETNVRPARKEGWTYIDYKFTLKRISVERSILCPDRDKDTKAGRLKEVWSRPYSEIQSDLRYEGECRARERGYK